MTERVLGPTGSPRRRWTLLLPLVAVIALGLYYVTGAQAVHELSFQLDGDTTNTAYSPPPSSNPLFDWNDVFNVSTDNVLNTQTVSVNSTNVGSGKTFDAAKFVRDFKSGSSCPGTLDSSLTTFCTGDDTTYATGSKDTLGIGNGGWQCNHDNNTNSKIDIMNAYVLSYTRSDGHKLFYFGLEKNKDNGTNDVGFWFLQNSASCSKPTSGSGLNFTGQHQDGDTLVVSEFSGGGGVSTIKAFRWAAAASGPLSGDGGCIDSNDNPDPHAGGCNNLPIATGADCKTTGAGDALCATTNAECTTAGQPCALDWNDDVTTKWLTSDATLGVGNTVVPPDFFEGGIDITAAFAGHAGTTPSCFATVVPDTRSSASPTATLFDYTLNQIGQCEGSLSTTANAAASREIAANGTISSDTDTANLKITGTTVWGGTLTWYLCGPNVNSCGNTGYVVTTQNVANTDNSNCGADCTYTSGSVNLTSAAGTGKYCWTAHFEPNQTSKDAGVDPEDDNGANECFIVTPKTPTLTTSASCSATPCVLGSTLSDTASLTGTANNPKNDGSNSNFPSIGGTTQPADGKITWTLYGPASDGSAQCTTTKTLSPNTADVSGDNTSYGPVTFVSDGVGKFTFAASYPGESPNTNAAAAVTCAAAGQNNATGEQVTVTGSASSSSAQRWVPNDRVTLTATTGTFLSGKLTVTLYRGTFTIANGVCTADQGATSVYTTGEQTVGPNQPSPFPFNTDNTSVVGTKSDGTAGFADGNYFWLIHYNDDNLTDPADRCEKTSLTITNNPS